MKKIDKLHMSAVASLGCIACYNIGINDSPAEIHHIGNGAMSKRASNFDVIPLCHAHHRTGGYGVAVHAGRKEWESNHGTEKDLLEQVRGMI